MPESLQWCVASKDALPYRRNSPSLSRNISIHLPWNPAAPRLRHLVTTSVLQLSVLVFTIFICDCKVDSDVWKITTGMKVCFSWGIQWASGSSFIILLFANNVVKTDERGSGPLKDKGIVTVFVESIVSVLGTGHKQIGDSGMID